MFVWNGRHRLGPKVIKLSHDTRRQGAPLLKVLSGSQLSTDSVRLTRQLRVIFCRRVARGSVEAGRTKRRKYYYTKVLYIYI